MSPPLNTKRPRQRYAVPPEQHDGANDGLSYKNMLTRRLPPDPAIFPPPQGQTAQNLAPNPIANAPTIPATKPPNLPSPESPLMRNINQQLRAVKEAQELQESRFQAYEATLAANLDAITRTSNLIDSMQEHQNKNDKIFNNLTSQMNSQAKKIDSLQTDLKAQFTAQNKHFIALEENIKNMTMANNQSQSQQQHTQYNQPFNPQHQNQQNNYNPQSNYTGYNHNSQSHAQQSYPYVPNDSHMTGGPGHDSKRGRSQSSSPTNTGPQGTQTPQDLSQPFTQSPPHSPGNSVSGKN